MGFISLLTLAFISTSLALAPNIAVVLVGWSSLVFLAPLLVTLA
jgi:hypothetical protein